METTVEYERKLEAPSGFELPDLGGEPLEPRIFTSVYHDTVARSLARAGITLRRRTERGRSVWQLKLPVDGARLELEEPGGPVGPPESLRELIRAHERHDPVVPVAELRTRRHGALVTRNGSSAEVTIDEVAVMDALRVESAFVELEVELKTGTPDAIGQIAKELRKAGARKSNGEPKVFRVLTIEKRKPRSKKPFELLRARLREQLDEILAHDPGTRLGTDPESLHEMRVAVRRSRALLRAGDRLVATDMHAIDLELQWLAGVLGEVRDVDVLLERLRGDAASLDQADRAAAGRLLRSLDRQRGRARRALLKALGSQRYVSLLDAYESLLEALEPTGDKATLESLAARELTKLRRAVKAVGKEPADEQLHGLRKHGKRVRYAHELAGATRVVQRAKAFQDVLGEHQDSAVAEERLRALSHDVPADQALAAGLLIARARERRRTARDAWPKAWRALAR
ncbi:MAG: CYTH and CHAD domain-containing protein [Actinomycetota bacterium]